ncbi:hypothetical protein I79_016759 [Cricetulus griseus]|uniref:Uncharacterized protein n=1 Tax=Cricetulus griseus TaxID=10029 RepID=G3I082_CRIGR|nr:hypothetical protein I79_016759 [Cricetulus griseus]
MAGLMGSLPMTLFPHSLIERPRAMEALIHSIPPSTSLREQGKSATEETLLEGERRKSHGRSSLYLSANHLMIK